jgi:hypothetical protein
MVVTPRPISGPAILTPGNSLGSYIVPTDQHESFVRTLSSLMRTQENFSVGHPSQIALSQARLTWRFFRDRLPKKKIHLVGMITLLILLSLGPGHPIPEARISQWCNSADGEDVYKILEQWRPRLGAESTYGDPKTELSMAVANTARQVRSREHRTVELQPSIRRAIGTHQHNTSVLARRQPGKAPVDGQQRGGSQRRTAMSQARCTQYYNRP